MDPWKVWVPYNLPGSPHPWALLTGVSPWSPPLAKGNPHMPRHPPWANAGIIEQTAWRAQGAQLGGHGERGWGAKVEGEAGARMQRRGQCWSPRRVAL